MSTPVTITGGRDVRINLGRKLAKLEIQPDDVLGWDLQDLRAAMEFYSGKQLRWFNILSDARQSKYAKAKDAGFLQSGVQYANDGYDLPPKMGGSRIITCPWATHGEAGCVENCIAETGRNQYHPHRQARHWRTHWLYEDPYSHIAVLVNDIVRFQAAAERKGLMAGIRLDTTSNLQWYRILPWLPDVFPDVMFLDYDRSPTTHLHLDSGWHLAHSMNAAVDGVDGIFKWIDRGVHASVICNDLQLLLDYADDRFVDADKTDMWMLDRDRPRIGLLKPKRPLTSSHPSVYEGRDIYQFMNRASSRPNK